MSVTLRALDQKTSEANFASFKEILVERNGEQVDFLKCNKEVVIQCYHSAMDASSPITIPLIILILICVMLVFGVLFLLKKNRALRRELKKERGCSENLTAGKD